MTTKEFNYERILEKIIDLKGDELDEWEEGFCDSVSSQDYPLTETQKKKILRIHRRYVVTRGR